jgi:hypothetical protein
MLKHHINFYILIWEKLIKIMELKNIFKKSQWNAVQFWNYITKNHILKKIIILLKYFMVLKHITLVQVSHVNY